MGVLTQTMTRLHEEIVSGNRSRQALRGELMRQTEERRSQVSALCTGFARDLAGAHRAWLERTPSGRSAATRKTEQAEQQSRPAQPTKAKGRAEEKPQVARTPKPAVRMRVARKSPAKPVARAPRAAKHPIKARKLA